MGIKDFFASEFETSDTHHKTSMQTRYYRATYEQTKDAILSLIKTYNGSNIIVMISIKKFHF